MVTVNLVTQRVREVHFINHISKNGQIQLSSSFNFKVNYAADNSKCTATLYQSVQMKDDPDTLFISAEITGIFNLQGIVDDETKKDAHVQCYDQLFPYLQSTVAQLATASGMPGFQLKKNVMKRESITFGKKVNPANPDQPVTLPIV